MPTRPPGQAQAGAGEPGWFRRGFGLGAGVALGLGAVATVAVVLLTMVLTGLVGLVGALGRPTQSPAGEVVWGSPDAPERLLAIPVNGVIVGHGSEGFGGTAGYEVARILDDLTEEDASGVVLEMNTPGGTIYGARAIADAVDRYQKRTGNRVVSFVQGLSASGGMYAMANSSRVIADHGTQVGSIGVIMGPFDRYKGVIGYQGSLFTQGIETEGGITREYLTQGTGKDLGSPFRDLTAAERAVLTTGLENAYQDFVTFVSRSRAIPVETLRDRIGAYIYDEKQALDLKLIDAIGNQDAAFRAAAELNEVAVDDVRVERLTSDPLDALLGGVFGRAGAGDAGSGGDGSDAVARPAAPGVPGTTPGPLCGRTRVVLAYYGDPLQACG